jgi:hypothetical protein
MMRVNAVLGGVAARALFVCGAVCAGASPAMAQAWVPPAGVGIVSVVFQDVDNTSHRLEDGSRLDGYDSISRGALLSLDYAVTDRLSFTIGLPYIGVKYTGPEPSFFELPIDDCLCWNRGWQDVAATVRYSLANGAFALTPSVAVGIPSHDYDYLGEAVLGRNLKEFRIAIDAGRRLDAVSDRLSVSGRYSYAFVERVLGLPNDRSNFGVEVGFLPVRRLGTRLGLSWQRSHGGLRSTEVTTDEQFQQYDRLLRDNNFHITGGTAYSLPWFDIFGAYTHYASGTDTHAGRAVTAGVSIPFER